MAKPRLVRPELPEDDEDAALIGELSSGPYSVSALQEKYSKTRGEIRSLEKRLGLKKEKKDVKIRLQSRKRLNLIPVDLPAVEPPAPAPAKPKPSGIVPGLIGVGCGLIGVALGVCNSIMNYQFGASFGHDERSCLVLGLVGLAIDGGALALLPAAGALGERRHYFLCLAAFLSWLPFLALSTVASFGFASSNIGDSLQARGSVAEQRADLTEQKTRAVSDRKAIGEHWSPQVLENQMAVALGSVPTKNRVSSKECTEPTLSAIYCSDYNRLKDAYVKAKVRIGLDEKIAALTAQIAALPPISSKDPVAEQIAQMAFGLVTPEQVRNYLVRCFAIIPGFASILLAITRVLLR